MHANARLTVHGRALLVRRVRSHGRPISHVCRELGVSRQSGHRWVARFDRNGWAGLADRSSRPRRHDDAVEERVLDARQRLRTGPVGVAAETGVPARSV